MTFVSRFSLQSASRWVASLVAVAGLCWVAQASAADTRPKFLPQLQSEWTKGLLVSRTDGVVIHGHGATATKQTVVTNAKQLMGPFHYLAPDDKTVMLMNRSGWGGAVTAVSVAWTYPEAVSLTVDNQFAGLNKYGSLLAVGKTSGKLYMPPGEACNTWASWSGCNSSLPWPLKRQDGSFYPGNEVVGYVKQQVNFYAGSGVSGPLYYFIHSNGEVWGYNTPQWHGYDALGWYGHCDGPWWGSFSVNLHWCNETNTQSGIYNTISELGMFGFAMERVHTGDDYNGTVAGFAPECVPGPCTATDKLVLAAPASPVDGYYTGWSITLGEYNGQIRRRVVTGYDAASRTITVSGSFSVVTTGIYAAQLTVGTPVTITPILNKAPKHVDRGFYRVQKDGVPFLVKRMIVGNGRGHMVLRPDGTLLSFPNPCTVDAFTGRPPVGQTDCSAASNAANVQPYYDMTYLVGTDNADIAAFTYNHGLVMRKNDGTYQFYGSGDVGAPMHCDASLAVAGYSSGKAMPLVDHSKIVSFRFIDSNYADGNIAIALMDDGSLQACGSNNYGKNTANGFLMGRIMLLLPTAPTNAKATDGSAGLGEVSMSWNAEAESEQYVLYQGDSPSVLTAYKTIPVTDYSIASFSDLYAPGTGNQKYFAVAGKNTVGEGPKSVVDGGWANYMPTSSKVDLPWDIGTSLAYAFPLTVDPNPMDQFTYTIQAQPVDGTIAYSAMSGKFSFTPKSGLVNGMLSGVNSFAYTVKDKNGAEINGVGKVVQRCANPELKYFSPGNALAFNNGNASITFNASACVSDVKFVVDVFDVDGVTLVKREELAGVTERGVNKVVTVPLPFKAPGDYPVKVTMTAKVLNGTVDVDNLPLTNPFSAEKQSTYKVMAVNIPALYANKWVAYQDEDIVNVELRGDSSNCPIVDELTAQSDPTKCFASWSEIPPGMFMAADNPLKITGALSTQGGHAATIWLHKFDPDGNKHDVASSTGQVVVNIPAPPVFTASGSFLGSVKVFLDKFEYIIKQVDGAPCTLGTPTEAATRALGGERSCGVTFTEMPADLDSQIASSQAVAYGRFRTEGEKTIRYQIHRWFRDGSSVLMGSGEYVVSAVHHGMDFTLKTKTTTPMALVDRWEGTVATNYDMGVRGCALSQSINEAKNSMQSGTTLYCYATYVQKPTSLVPSYRNPLALAGTFPGPGTYPIEYKVSMVFPADQVRQEQEIVLKHETINLEVTPTAPPEMAFTPTGKVTVGATETDPGATVVVYPQGTLVGRVRMNRLVAKTVDIDILDETGTVTASYPNVRLGVQKYLAAPASKSAWSTGKLTIRAKYTEFPDIKSEQTIDYVTLLPPGIMAQLATSRYTLDNATDLKAVVTVGKRKLIPDVGMVLDGTQIGPWKVELGMYKRTSDGTLGWEASSEAVDLVDGKAEFAMTPKMPAMNVMARAWAISPIPQIAQGQSVYTVPSKILVRKGTPIEVGIRAKARYFATSEPFTMLMMGGTFKNATDFTALDKATWYSSTDGGASWIVDPKGMGMMLSTLLREDTIYRLVTKNRYTGLEYDSDPLLVKWQPSTTGGAVEATSLANLGVYTAETMGEVQPLSLKAYASNANLRAPVFVSVQNTTFVGPALYDWKLDGVLQDGANKYAFGTTITTPGDHTFEVMTVGSDSRPYRGTFTVSVVPNQLPGCTLNPVKHEKYVLVSSVCSDPDGKITAARWTVNGLNSTYTQPNLYAPLPKAGQSYEVKLTVMDDSKESAEATVTIGPY